MLSIIRIFTTARRLEEIQLQYHHHLQDLYDLVQKWVNFSTINDKKLPSSSPNFPLYSWGLRCLACERLLEISCCCTCNSWNQISDRTTTFLNGEKDGWGQSSNSTCRNIGNVEPAEAPREWNASLASWRQVGWKEDISQQRLRTDSTSQKRQSRGEKPCETAFAWSEPNKGKTQFCFILQETAAAAK